MAHGNASHRLYVHGGLYLHAMGASAASLGVGVQDFRFGVQGATWTLRGSMVIASEVISIRTRSIPYTLNPEAPYSPLEQKPF